MKFPVLPALGALTSAAGRVAALHLPPRPFPGRTQPARTPPPGVRAHHRGPPVGGSGGARRFGPRAGGYYAGVLALALSMLASSAHAQDPTRPPGAPPPFVHGVRVNPKGDTVTVPGNSTDTVMFSITNSDTAVHIYTLVCHAGGVASGCSAPSEIGMDPMESDSIRVTFTATGTTGTGWVSLVASGAFTDSGWVNVKIGSTPPPPSPVLSQPRQPDSVFNRAHCLTASAGIADWSCGDALFMLTTPGYTTLDRARSLTLTYASATASLQPLVAVNVGLDATVLTHVTAVLAVQGTVQTTTTYTPWTSATKLLVLGWNAGTSATGAYPYTLTVRAVRATDSSSSTVSGLLYVVNRKTSPYGAGWEWLGVERLVLNQPVGSGLAHILWVDGDGSTKLYRQVNSTTWVAPPEAYRDTITLAGGVYTRTLRHGVQVMFDNTGRHIKTTNRQTQVTNFYWRSATQLDSVRVPPAGSGGRTFILHYNASSFLDSVRVGGRDVGITDSSGLLTRWRWPDSSSTDTIRFHFDASGRIDSTLDARGGATRLHYTAFGLVDTAKVWYDSATSHVAATTKFTPWQSVGYAGSAAGDTAKAFTSIIGPRGVGDSAEFHVDKWGAPIAIFDPMHQLTKYVRGNATVPAMVTEIDFPNTRKAFLKYNSRANLDTLTDSTWAPNAFPKQRTVWAYADANDADSPSQITAPDSTITQFTYNTLGLTATMTDARHHKTSYTYETVNSASLGQLLTATEDSVPVWIEAANTDSLRPLVTTLTYDSSGNTATVKNPAGGIAKFQHATPSGLISQVDNAMGFRTQYHYDRMDRLIRKVTQHAAGDASNGCLNQREFTCGDSTLITALNPAGDSDVTTSTYTHGQLSQVLDPRSVSRAYHYDRRGLLVGEVDEAGRRDSVVYDRGGLAVKQVTRYGTALTFAYDAAGRDTSWIMPARGTFMFDSTYTAPADTVRSTYDSVGNLLVHRSRVGDITRNYFANGALRNEVRHGAVSGPHLVADSVQLAYDRFGRLDSLRWRGGDVVRYGFAPSGDLDSVFVDWLNGVTAVHETYAMHWDSLGRRQQVKYPYNAMTATAHYDRLGILRRLMVANSAPVSGNRFRDSLVQNTVDLLGRPLHQQIFCAGLTSADVGNPCGDWFPKEQTTRYNRLGAVVEQILTDRAGTVATDTLRYDQSGNRISLHDRGVPGVLSGFSYPAASNRIAAKFDSVLEGADTLKPNRHFLYDSTGARWVESTVVPPTDTFAMQIYQYDAAGRLMGSAQGSSTRPIVFVTQPNSCMYDADGRAVQPCGAGAVTLFGDNVIHDPNGNWFYVHAPGIDEPLLAIKRNTGDNTVQARLEMVSNGRGQLVAVGDSAGQLNSTYAQQVPGSNGGPWGSGTTTRAQTFNPRRWATPGQSDTISTFRTRQYDPATGVWLQEDPVGLAGGINLYQYNGNDPNSFGDPFGTCPPADENYRNCEPGSANWYANRIAAGKGNRALNEIGGTLATCAESLACNAVLAVAAPIGNAAVRIGNAVRAAATSEGNSTIQMGSDVEARVAGRLWTGSGTRALIERRTGEEIGRESADALRQYRMPALKRTGPNAGKVAANLVRILENGKEAANVHLIVP